MIRALRWLALAFALLGTLQCGAQTAAQRVILLNRAGPELAPPLTAASWAVVGNDATHVATFSGSALRFQSDTTSPQLLVQTSMLTVGKRYRVRAYTSAYTSGSIKTDSFGAVVLSAGVGMVEFVGTAISPFFQITRNTTNVDLTVSLLSVREYR